MDRRRFLELMLFCAVVIVLMGAVSESAQAVQDAQRKYNVLFLAVDDLNDWVGCLGGHPQAKTPNIDRLAESGILFEQAYCAAPLCNPSRTAIMTGLRSSTTGIYGNGDRSWFRDVPEFKDWVTIPQYFRQHGYMALTGGKIFHLPDGKFSDPVSWDRQYSTRMGTPFPPPEKRLQHGMSGKFTNNYYNDWADWVPLEIPEEETDDWKTAELAAEFLQQEHDKPFFLACGIFRPHLRWYIPKKYFDMHPLDEIQLPPHLENDLDDVPPMGHKMAGQAFGVVREHGQWKKAVQGYLAAGSFADACAGVVLDSLKKSIYRDNTIIVLFGDHGFHIGEKNHISKLTLWEEATQTPLIIRVPGGAPTDPNRCKRPVSLVDLYPTLVELCGLPPRDGLDGRSIASLVREPKRDWPYPAVITQFQSHAVRTERYHYIRYGDGEEELYDDAVDPNGWNNLANDPKYAGTKGELKKWLP
jgi:arylsulfatase A-like enzyme